MKHNKKNILDLLNQIGSMLAHSILLFPYSLFLYIRKREFRISERLSLVLNHWSKEDLPGWISAVVTTNGVPWNSKQLSCVVKKVSSVFKALAWRIPENSRPIDLTNTQRKSCASQKLVEPITKKNSNKTGERKRIPNQFSLRFPFNRLI